MQSEPEQHTEKSSGEHGQSVIPRGESVAFRGPLHSPVLRSIVFAGVAFFFYAAWAAWANSMHGQEMALRAAITQGTYSAVVTLVMTSLLEMLFRGGAPVFWRALRAVLVTTLVLMASSVLTHMIAGTLEIIMTVLPSWIFGSLFAVTYCLGLARGERRESESAIASALTSANP